MLCCWLPLPKRSTRTRLGKTGSAWANNALIQGWNVGHLAKGQTQLVFALHMD